ncbi:MAG: RNA-binding S4 domain-containing protein [Propionibacteriales bacterium]|nr:RNA-binding S4 domain-containing protein [Propionibacteriales bacterium]
MSERRRRGEPLTPHVSVHVREGVIRLGQFLKLSDATGSGSDAKALLAAEAVTVNGQVESRRGRQLQPGDVVAVGSKSYLVSTGQVPSANRSSGS